MSLTASIHSISAGLVGAEGAQGIGKNRAWKPAPGSEKQKIFLSLHKPRHYDYIKGRGFLRAVGSTDVNFVNTFMKQEGYTVKLVAGRGPGLYMAGSLNLPVTWKTEGTRAFVENNSMMYQAARIPDPRFYSAQGWYFPIASLQTKEGVSVYITPLGDVKINDGFHLLETCKSIFKLPKAMYEYGGIVFPMVDLRQNEDLDWIKGLHTTGSDGQDYPINQVVLQNILKIDHRGALAKSGAAMAVTRGDKHESIPKPDFVIHETFLVLFSLSGIEPALFAAVVTPEDWKDPNPPQVEQVAAVVSDDVHPTPAELQ